MAVLVYSHCTKSSNLGNLLCAHWCWSLTPCHPLYCAAVLCLIGPPGPLKANWGEMKWWWTTEPWLHKASLKGKNIYLRRCIHLREWSSGSMSTVTRTDCSFEWRFWNINDWKWWDLQLKNIVILNKGPESSSSTYIINFLHLFQSHIMIYHR